ncbi:DUF1593 domain-containing protein [Lacihabitans sp. LS3-19]|uniref:nucleoside hydrolase-like domain-containing protein n=1 Tax=Lacihabitans sp. LS3-19 TaxID=2487335 RepID=UPI0020CC2C35|nr:nucleoside hydrolase-like domain-containing protein [Lacihabitans sp. LS3-19]MCP9770430.1 DUF1593 domain-containing protein [Lacihabitans sp. LS3-19]
MSKNSFIVILSLLLIQFTFVSGFSQKTKPRVIISTDIGGTDPDDFQSMIHLLMYSDLFELEGLISSPFGNGRKKDLLDMIDLYEKDRPSLAKSIKDLATVKQLQKICKQGAKPAAPFLGYTNPTEGSDWIIKCAKKKSSKPLYILVWGGIEDVAQALHDAPEIENKLRVYWIGGPNKKWSINAYAYIAEHHPNLWIIENNATYRGWFMEDENAPKNMSGAAYYENFVKGHGAMGENFVNHYKGHIKMGDTPSLAYLMNGDSNDPTTDSWGGKFTKINHSSRIIITGSTNKADSVIAYGIVEWRFRGPEANIPRDSVCFIIEIQKQEWPGYYLGNGVYGVRYSSKKPEKSSYMTHSLIPELNGLKGQYISTAPWPGPGGKDDYILGKNWFSDLPNPELFLEDQQGAKTISKFRNEYLSDWAKRWSFIK